MKLCSKDGGTPDFFSFLFSTLGEKFGLDDHRLFGKDSRSQHFEESLHKNNVYKWYKIRIKCETVRNGSNRVRSIE